jgi:hypothetical protein
MKKIPTVDQNLSALCIVMMLGPRSPLYRTLLSRLLPFVSKKSNAFKFKFTNLTMHFSLFFKALFQREDMLVRVGILTLAWQLSKKLKEPILIGTAVLRKQIEELVKEPTLKCQFFASCL